MFNLIRLIFISVVILLFCSLPPLPAFATDFPLDSVTITSDFGPRNVRNSWFHTGIDLRAANGTPVMSITDGTVTLKGFGATATDLYFLTIFSGFTHRYLHIFCDDPTQCPDTVQTEFVRVGDSVVESQRVATSNATGTTAPHLHFDIVQSDGSKPNPMTFLPFDPMGPPEVEIRAPDDDPAGDRPLSGRVEVRAMIDTRENGFDLDQVRILVDSEVVEDFTYVPRSENVRPFDGASTGVRPEQNGRDEFIFFWQSAERDATGAGLRFEDGMHELAVCGVDIHGEENCETVNVRTDNRREIGFVIDDTGSMGNEIAQVRATAIDFVQRVSSDPNQLVKYSIWTFKDSVAFRGETSDPAQAVAILSGITASGGGDCPEASGAALDAAGSSAERGSELLLFTDADPREGAAFLASVQASLAARDIAVHSFVSGSCTSPSTLDFDQDSQDGESEFSIMQTSNSFEVFESISNATGGFFFAINASQYPEAMHAVGTRVLNNVRIAMGKANLEGGTRIIEIPTDISLSNLSVTVQHDPGIDVVLEQPDGNPADPSDPDTEFRSQSGLLQIDVIEPSTGQWLLLISGNGNFSATADGRSDVDASVVSPLMASPFSEFPVQIQTVGSLSGVEGVIFSETGERLGRFDLFDDGDHGDGATGDGVFGGVIESVPNSTFAIGVEGIGGPYSDVSVISLEPTEGEELGGEGEDPIPVLRDLVQRVDPRFISVDDSVLPITIAVRPGSERVLISESARGVLTVAVLTTAMADGDPTDFDATTLSADNVRLDPGGARPVHERGHEEDVDGDGDLDKVFHFSLNDLELPVGSSEVRLIGTTDDGLNVLGSEEVFVK